MKIKKMFSLFMILVLTLSMQLIINAEETDHNHTDDIIVCDYEIMPLETCANCGEFAYYRCNGDAIYDGRTIHSYSGGQCAIVWRISTASKVCTWCGYSRPLYADVTGTDPSSGYAYHDCYQHHTYCGIGDYDTCPMDDYNYPSW